MYSDEVTGLVQEYEKIQEDLRLRTMHRKKTLRHEKAYERQIEILKRISQLCPNESPMDVVRTVSNVYD